jgi:hypothetical protein
MTGRKDDTMPSFKVMLHKNAIWDGKPHVSVAAEDPKGAAEQVVGRPLEADGPMGRLRAEVYQTGITEVGKAFFYDPAGYSGE